MSIGMGHPTRDELLAMAYADGELAPDARAEMDARLASEPELGRMVVHYQRLELLARRCAPPEPMDHEWKRLAADGIHRAGLGLGFALLVAGAVGLAGFVAYEVWAADMNLAAKLSLCTILFALTLLLLTTLRARLRTLPFDPYSEVER